MGEDSHDKTQTADYRLQTLQTVQFFLFAFFKTVIFPITTLW